ncbi:hypothetical protein Tco_1232830 [Tanacetum coccineum]
MEKLNMIRFEERSYVTKRLRANSPMSINQVHKACNSRVVLLEFWDSRDNALVNTILLEIPGRLYMFIQQALDLDKQLLQTSNTLKDLRSELKDEETNFLALEQANYGTSRQDRVTAKLKTENPSLDTSIRKDGVTAKLRTRNSRIHLSGSIDPIPKVMVANEGIKIVPTETLKAGRYRKEKPIIFSSINPVTEKLQRLQTLIIFAIVATFAGGWCGMEWATQPCGGESEREPS